MLGLETSVETYDVRTQAPDSQFLPGPRERRCGTDNVLSYLAHAPIKTSTDGESTI